MAQKSSEFIVGAVAVNSTKGTGSAAFNDPWIKNHLTCYQWPDICFQHPVYFKDHMLTGFCNKHIPILPLVVGHINKAEQFSHPGGASEGVCLLVMLR